MNSTTFTIWHSRQISPTRRVAAHPLDLPDAEDALPWEALQGLWADTIVEFTNEQNVELAGVLDEMLTGKLPSSRLAHRIQLDHVGLAKTIVTLNVNGSYAVMSTGGTISPAQLVLGVLAAIHPLRPPKRALMLRALQDFTAGRNTRTFEAAWATATLGLPPGDASSEEIKRAFRIRVKETHPDITDDLDAHAHTVQDFVKAKNVLLRHHEEQSGD